MTTKQTIEEILKTEGWVKLDSPSDTSIDAIGVLECKNVQKALDAYVTSRIVYNQGAETTNKSQLYVKKEDYETAKQKLKDAKILEV